MITDLKTSREKGMHFQLKRMEGEWSGIAKTWLEPGKLADESPITGTIKPVLGGKYLLHEYKGNFQGKPLEGICIIGYQLDLQKFQSAWVDSFHTGTAILFSEGTRGDKHMKMLGGYAYVTPEFEQHWGWRTEYIMIKDNELLITAYNISPEGDEEKATEIRYSRK